MTTGTLPACSQYVNCLIGPQLPFVSHPLRPTSPMIDPRLKTLAERIETLVDSSDYSRVEIAGAIGVDKSTITKWVKGDRTPTMKNLMDLADLLQVEMSDLWTGPEAVPATPEQKLMQDRMGKMTPEQQQALLALAATMARNSGA